MDIPHAATEALLALASQLQMPGLALDPDGLRALAIGDRLVVHLQADVATQEFVLFAVVATLAPFPPAEQLARLLQANRFWRETGGATLSLDDEQPPRVVMARRISWLNTTPANFVEAFESFVDYLSEWATQLADSGSPPTDMMSMNMRFA